MEIHKNKIYVSEKDYQDYLYSSNRQNRILRFWINIFRGMPVKFQQEAKSKPTNLEKQFTKESELKGAILYQFKTEGASIELKEYLNKYRVFVENETEDIAEWKLQVKRQNKDLFNSF